MDHYFQNYILKKDIPIIIHGIRYTLPLLPEEYAMLYAKYIGTEYVENKTFKKQFWNDFKKHFHLKYLK